ncbi:forkhead box protein I1 [Coprinopsis cinerea okayama7|uniref:Forkhead box protein I1 n=1 Tax=Coprinopsis cinerea (strain Okayama-7 / 130 / ATCC MYA-4618 / FGSC 9003) TaxID=240176 RepID=D6RNV7_COPC7|nr:forkhead box protein I1 [Coprinopsis cinerea okayama7\|eukprot:XP_002910853.1 forkhead box protein I1 [Coprinopsis cinerea okayama7\
MTDLNVSPISQLLHSLGMTREDLNKRSNEMRQFLTANDSMPSRVPELTSGYRSRSSSDLRSGTRSASSSFSLSRSISRASSHSRREGSPPSTPIKSEQSEGGLPSRPMDNMEIIIERQRQTRKERRSRKDKERAVAGKSLVPPPSPSPSSTSQSAVSLDSFMQSRDDRPQSAAGSESASATTSSEVLDPPPVTPHKSKYYREHTIHMSNPRPRKDTSCKAETPTPTKLPSQPPVPSHPIPAYYPFPPFAAYGQYIPGHYPIPHASTSALPVTPQSNRILTSHSTAKPPAKSSTPLPASSPMHASSSPPPSSPAPQIVNLVSSPGPMGSSPAKEQYDKLPFKLPPGPYSSKKPDLSYAALVGQAILASPDHRLTLQEIYDYITIVYPHYKRGETTWMNSIRHVLSTTAVFRKVPRDRSVGRTLWAIYDEDIECFKGGGFKKHLCKDMVKQQAEKDKKNKSRKRSDVEEDASAETRKPKRSRKDTSHKVSNSSFSAPDASASGTLSQVPLLNPQPSFMVAGTSSHPFFPRPTPHHQPYYESCLPQPQLLPAEVIFPPLPPTAALASRSTSVTSDDKGSGRAPTPPPPIEKTASEATDVSESSSLLSVPELTPNRSSSTTPPSSVPATSDMDIDLTEAKSTENGKISESNGAIAIAGVDDNANGRETSSSSLAIDDDNVFNSSLLGPVQFWGESPRTASLLQPGIELLNFDAMADDEEEEEGEKALNSKGQLLGRKITMFPPVPASPTLGLRSKTGASGESSLSFKEIGRPKTPSGSKPPSADSGAPSTPPRRVKLSSTRTPISHKGLHMSPSASLAHYKSNLDPPRTERLEPPPLLSFSKSAETETLASLQDEGYDPMRTPRRSSTHGGSSSLAGAPPITPKRGGGFESLFRTPAGFSPFRTPRSRAVMDPNDPRVLLDEELSRPSLIDDSPGGIFGKGKLLYESPGFDSWANSPKKYWHW